MWNRILRTFRGGLRDRSGPYRLQVLCDGAPAWSRRHDGETYVLGRCSDRYTLRIINCSGRRVEAVVSVDGRDVIDGEPADFRRKSGYLVPAGGHVDIPGWRISAGRVAAFRFSRVGDSYAAARDGGCDVGVIGVAIFPEGQERPERAVSPWVHRPVSRPFWDSGETDHEACLSSAPCGAPSPSARASCAQSACDDRPGLGTSFGEPLEAPAREVLFCRADGERPAALLGVRYSDHRGLSALGIDVGAWDDCRDADVRRRAEPFRASRGYASPPPGWEEW